MLAARAELHADRAGVITFVCFQWNTGFREYRPEHVNALARQVNRHCTVPHRFVCITDETEGYEPAVKTMPLPKAARLVANIPSPEGARFPSCYRRLWLFSADAQALLGSRVMLLDIDCLVVGSLDQLFDIDADLVCCRPRKSWGREDRVMGGTWLLKTGALAWVWAEFVADPKGWIQKARAAGWRGSDQAYLSYRLAGKYVLWPRDIGIYSSQDGTDKWTRPPEDARIVHFNGPRKPWAMKSKWISEALA